jgi:glucose-6-phosphate isomerase
VLHASLRAGDSAPDEVRGVLARMRELAARLRGGAWTGASGKPLRRLIHLGIGGSDLGPRVLVDALAEPADSPIELRFVSNVDPLELDRALAGSDAEETLFVVVSKTWTTQETLANATAARQWLADRLPRGASISSHLLGVTMAEKAAREFGAGEVLPLWDWVGGRFSLWSAVGFSAMCAIGAQRFDELLAGAAEIDRHAAESPAEASVPALMALLGVWNVNFLGLHSHAVLPYSHALRLLPAHLQQLEMESNGKSVDRESRTIDYATAPVLFGSEGTVGQHSFHQLLHQGTQAVPADFIVAERGAGDPARRAILNAHAEAQAEALAFGTGKGVADGAQAELAPERRCPGNRPSSTLVIEQVDARNLGRLLALYEHKVFVQGVIWNINSYDQWGVELGKRLAARILAAR